MRNFSARHLGAEARDCLNKTGALHLVQSLDEGMRHAVAIAAMRAEFGLHRWGKPAGRPIQPVQT
jgi:hypothetical protein